VCRAGQTASQTDAHQEHRDTERGVVDGEGGGGKVVVRWWFEVGLG
jgi:hypothetical protein